MNRKRLKSQAGTAAFGRGEGYFESGRVGNLRFHTHGVQAKVSGRHVYQVKLDWSDGFDYRCNCPMGEQGDCCKHCVAVGLAWLNRDKKADNTTESEDERIRNWLERREKQALIGIIMEASESDETLFKRLSLNASASSLDLNALEQSIRNTIETDFIDYYHMRSYVEELGDVTNMLEALLDDGYASEVQELALYAVDCMKNAYNNMDDSDGDAGGEMNCWQEIHLRACEAAPPENDAERKVLASTLFDREIYSEIDEFYGSAEKYAGLFGKAGMARFRGLAEQAWNKLPVLKPGEKEDYRGDRYRITSMMESLARASDRVDDLVAIKARNLSVAYHFLQIAQILGKEKRFDEALVWAEKGVAAFASNPDSRLEEYLAELYQQRKAFDKAVALVWNIFERQPSLHSWETLKTFSSKAKNWESEWQQRALDHVRCHIVEEKKRGANYFHKPDHSLLVQIFLHENDMESAWQEANAGNCNAGLWRALGEKLGKHDPSRATSCWQRLVEPIINRKKNDAYAEAVQMMLTIGEWMKQAEKESEFTHWIQEIRLRHKPKRNLMKLMDGKKLGVRR